MDFLITKVTEGNIPRNKWLELREAVKSYDNKEIIITIERKTKKRSLAQNKYYHAVCVKMITLRLRELGWEIEGRLIDESDVHLMLTTRFLKRDIVSPDGEFLTTYLGTSQLSTLQFMEYIDSIIKWAAEYLQMYIPEPVSMT